MNLYHMLTLMSGYFCVITSTLLHTRNPYTAFQLPPYIESIAGKPAELAEAL
jgi:hypothetical protein